MNSEDFGAAVRDLFGRGWQARLAQTLGVDVSTIRRWTGASMSPPPTVEAYLSMMGSRQETRGTLVFERQEIGTPLDVLVDPEVLTYEALARTLPVPGVPDPKRMPSVTCAPSDTNPRRIAISLKAERIDEIGTDDVSLILTRHPDSHHMRGYRGAARQAGHSTAAAFCRDHYYTLLAHRTAGPAILLHHIATHQAVNRLVWSAALPGERTILGSRLC